MRAFVALDISEAARASLARLQDDLKRSGADVAWVAPGNIHLTLKFLGEITDDQRTAFEAELRRIAASTPAFTASLEGVDAFPTVPAPRIIWVGMKQGSAEATALAVQLEAAARTLGLRTEERPFSAHATLGRVRSPRGRPALVDRLKSVHWPVPPPWPMAAVILYRSDLSPKGATYTPVVQAPLRAS